MKFKSNKGFTGIDISVATVIFIIFASIVATLFYNTTVTSKKIERKTTATNLCIEIIEALKGSPFDKLTKTEDAPMNIENLQTISGKTINVPNGYVPEITIEDYKDENVIKILRVTISYKENNKTEEITIETLVKNI